MVHATATATAHVLLTAGTLVCAIPVRHVIETMRPLPVETLHTAVRALRGVASIRGAATPVLDLRVLLGAATAGQEPGRFVTIRAGSRVAALAVDRVEGVRTLDLAAFGELPPLLSAAQHTMIEAIRAADAQLTVVLDSARIVPDEVWSAQQAAPGTA